MGLSVDYHVNPGLNEFRISVNTSDKKINIPDSGILSDSGIRHDWISSNSEILLSLKTQPKNTWLNYDLLGLIFFQISRYEEYLGLGTDEHNRFPASKSTLHQTGWLQHPIVDIIVQVLRKKIESTFNINALDRELTLLSTCDVDFPWYRKNVRFPWSMFKENSAGKDPFDTYDEIISIHEENKIDLRFFFLVAGEQPYEKISRYKKGSLKKLINQISTTSRTGIHPPYKSATDQKRMKHAIQTYEVLTGTKPTHSRQHYLRVTLPVTYRLLMANGIEEDYSMGYADAIGFRAGTAFTYDWYDLEKEERTELKIHPLMAMDVTLRYYMKLDAEAASAQLNTLKENAKETGGQFGLLWHNNNLSTREGWDTYRAVYFNFIALFNA